MNIKLYPQYNIVNDRRKQQVSVESDRRSGIDRRSADRLQIDTGLKRDIFEIKSKVVNFQNSSVSNPVQKAQTDLKNPTSIKDVSEKTIIHSGDTFVKSTDRVQENSKVEVPKAESTSSSALGALAFMFGGIIAATTMGAAAVGAIVGLGAYFGSKLLKEVISSRMKK